MADTATQEKAQAQSVEFSEANDSPAVGPGSGIEVLLDLNLPVTVAIGKQEMSIQKLLQLGPGSVLKLDKSIDAPVDLYLKDTKFATGSVVVVEGRFAVKIEEVFGLATAEEPSEEKTEE